MVNHQRLIRNINACRPRHGECPFWWLGQLGFILKLGETVLYIDPYLTDRVTRLVLPVLDAPDLANARLVIGTHDHIDHIDREAWPGILKAAHDVQFVVPDLLREPLAADLRMPPERFIGLDDGRTVDIAGIRITGIAAAHEFLDRDKASGRYPYVGCVIEGNGVTIYHSGDCCMYEGLETKLRKWSFDIIFIPINGRDAVRYKRGCLGNMTYQEAADLAGALQPRLTVPGHYGMFENNTVDPSLFVDYMKVKHGRLKVCLCEPGERNVYTV